MFVQENVKHDRAKTVSVLPEVVVDNTPLFIVKSYNDRASFEFTKAAMAAMKLEVGHNIAVVRNYVSGDVVEPIVIANVLNVEYVKTKNVTNRARKLAAPKLRGNLCAISEKFVSLVVDKFQLTNEELTQGVAFKLVDACDEDGHVQTFERYFNTELMDVITTGNRIHDTVVENKEQLLAETAEVEIDEMEDVTIPVTQD